MALIKCPECGKEISDKAGACPNCGCPIASTPTSIKVRALSDDGGVKKTRYYINGKLIAEVPVGSTVTIAISKPTVIEVMQKTLFSEYGRDWKFVATPGKCYESRYCKPGFALWQTVITEVSFV